MHETDNKNEMIKISVILPVYGQAKHLYTCLETVLLQNLQETEVICVIDGASDESRNIISELAWTDDRLRIIEQDNKSVEEALNTGIKEAHGEYLAFIDPDDCYYNFKALELLYNTAKQNSAVICGGGFEIQEEDCDGTDTFAETGVKSVFNEDRFYTYREYQYDKGFQRFIYDRGFILKNNLFFTPLKSFWEPVWFVKTLHEAGSFFGVPEKVYSYRSVRREDASDKEKVCSIISGLTGVAKLAADEGYDRLLDLERMRLVRGVAMDVYPYVCKSDGDVLDLLSAFEDVTGSEGIERELLSCVLKKRDDRLAFFEEESERQQKSIERYSAENEALKKRTLSEQETIGRLKENLAAVLDEMGLMMKTGKSRKGGNILPYPFVHTTGEKAGISWTDLGDGRIEANGTALEDVRFLLTPSMDKKALETHHKRYIVSTGAENSSSFTWFISGKVGNREDPEDKQFMRSLAENEADGFSESFVFDSSGYDYFDKIAIVIKKGRVVDHVVFKPEICPID